MPPKKNPAGGGRGRGAPGRGGGRGAAAPPHVVRRGNARDQNAQAVRGAGRGRGRGPPLRRDGGAGGGDRGRAIEQVEGQRAQLQRDLDEARAARARAARARAALGKRPHVKASRDPPSKRGPKKK